MSGRRQKKKSYSNRNGRAGRSQNRSRNGRQSQKQVQRNVKDRLFRYLFEKDRDALLDLYNALNGTDYRDPSRLEIVTIESAVYVVMKNDLAYILSGTLSMYEHQSTYSPNLPVRFFIYLAQEYQTVIERAEKSLYGSGRISLPTPQCVVFYNGTKELPEETTLKLSDAFENKKAKADVELTVRMLNINHGHNERLMEQCRVLEEYSKLVAVTRDFMRTTKDLQAALDQAIDYCIKNGILKEFLLRNRAEVLGMLLEEFDAEKYERTIRGEGLAEGEANKLREQVRKKLAKNKPISLIAEELEEEISVIEAIIGQLRH
ncbi:MAG: hypothetical protein NC415_09995 [bacterium]|nr:hypothetical protein [bacterium]